MSDPCEKCQILLKGSHQCDGNPCGHKVVFERERHNNELIANEREKIYKRLEAMVYTAHDSVHDWPVVDFADIDCLFAELKSDVT